MIAIVHCMHCDADIAVEAELNRSGAWVAVFDEDCDCGAILKGRITCCMTKEKGEMMKNIGDTCISLSRKECNAIINAIEWYIEYADVGLDQRETGLPDGKEKDSLDELVLKLKGWKKTNAKRGGK